MKVKKAEITAFLSLIVLFVYLEKRELKEVSLLMEVKEFLVGIHIYPRKQEK